jgi:hypothetical protein
MSSSLRKTSSNEEVELCQLRKVPASTFFRERWYKPRKKSDPKETYYQKIKREKGIK